MGLEIVTGVGEMDAAAPAPARMLDDTRPARLESIDDACPGRLERGVIIEYIGKRMVSYIIGLKFIVLEKFAWVDPALGVDGDLAETCATMVASDMFEVYVPSGLISALAAETTRATARGGDRSIRVARPA